MKKNYKLTYYQRIADILSNPEETEFYLNFAKEHNFYDPKTPLKMVVSEAYSRYRAYPYLLLIASPEEISFCKVSERTDFIVRGVKVDAKVRTTNHTDFEGDAYVDSSKWGINKAIIVVWEDNYAALFNTKKTKDTYEGWIYSNKNSTENNTEKVRKKVTHFNYNNAMYTWSTDGR